MNPVSEETNNFPVGKTVGLGGGILKKSVQLGFENPTIVKIYILCH